MRKGEKSVWIPETVHADLRIDAAIAKMTIKDYLVKIIKEARKK